MNGKASNIISRLHLRNFKCFEDQRFELGQMTLLSGLNGTGKSSVIQSLVLLRQSYQQGILRTVGLALNGDLVQLGTASDVLFEGAIKSEFGFDLGFSNQMSACWRFEYDVEADVVKLASPPVPDEIYNTSLFRDSFQYLSAERSGPRAAFPTSDYWVREHRQLGVRGEYTSHFISLFGAHRIVSEVLRHPREQAMTLKPQIESWMGEVSPGVQVHAKSHPDIDLVSLQYSFVLGDQVGSNPYRSTNVGFGITYTLPIVVALLASAPGDLVLLENPEAHLHPQGQVKIGELMARAASCGIQVVVETHSDHILNGVRIAVRDGLVSPDQLRIYFLGRRAAASQINSQVIEPKVDRNGRIDRWPDGFFDEWDKSLERLL
jgi:predicted ATPase